MYASADERLAELPPAPEASLLPRIRERFIASDKTLVVLDDDPTGTQTCYDVTVLTSWGVDLLTRELEKKPSILFILTNSRSLTEDKAVALAAEIGNNLVAARQKCGRAFVVVSRSDSTLRGHFPAEVDAVAGALGQPDSVRLLVPAFMEGGRITIGDTHYVQEQGKLIPVAETPFARDPAFGYKHANLRHWVEEKTRGRIKADEVVSISIEDLRLGGAGKVEERLRGCRAGGVCIANACTHRDLEVLVMGLLRAESRGQQFIYRTSATFVPIRAGLAAGRILHDFRPWVAGANGSLIVVGSYVPKSTRQLAHLLQETSLHAVEVNVRHLILLDDDQGYAEMLAAEIDQRIMGGHDVVIYTSRQLEKGVDAKTSLAINHKVSSFLVQIIRALSARPSLLVTKGGITSSDIATKGLGVEAAQVLGQVIPGVPVLYLKQAARFNGLLHTVFPGNVGDDLALLDVWQKLKGRK